MTPEIVRLVLESGIAGLALYFMFRINQGLRNDILSVLEEIRDKI